MSVNLPLLAPIHPAGREPLPPGLTEDDRPVLLQQKKVESYMTMAAESCLFKSALSGGAGTPHLYSSWTGVF